MMAIMILCFFELNLDMHISSVPCVTLFTINKTVQGNLGSNVNFNYSANLTTKSNIVSGGIVADDIDRCTYVTRSKSWVHYIGQIYAIMTLIISLNKVRGFNAKQ